MPFKQFADDYKPPHPEPRIVIDPNYKSCVKPFKEIHPPVDFVEYMQNPKPLLFSRDGYTYERPVRLEALYEIKKEHGPTGPKFRLVCGNTSVGIYETHSIYAEEALDPHYLVDISAIPELQQVDDDDEGLTLGGAVTLLRLLEVLDEVIAARDSVQMRGLSAMREHARVVANHQIRNEASLAGNVHIATNLGFLSDMVLVLATLGAKVTVSSQSGSQEHEILELPTDDELPKDAIYESFRIPYTQEREYVRTFKIRRRNEDSHAIVNAGFWVRFDAEMRVADCRIVYNGIKADYKLESTTYGLKFHPITVEETRAALLGKAWNEDTLREALTTLVSEVAAYEPPTNAAGKPFEIGQIPFSYRASLAETLFYKFFVSVAVEAESGVVSPKVRSAGDTYHRPVSSGQQFYNSYPEELPVSDPYIKLSAFMQATGEARYTHDVERPPNTLEAAFVYSLIAHGKFSYQLPLTSAHGTKGERVTAEELDQFLTDWHPDFVSYVTYGDIALENRPGNWTGVGVDDPIFVPSQDQPVPKSVQDGAGKHFQPYHVTSVGAPIGLIVAKNQLAARQIANFVRTQCIHFEPEPALDFHQAIKDTNYFPQNPATNPTLTHIPEITRPGSNSDWLAAPNKPFQEGDQTFPVVHGHHRTGYQNHFYLETMITLAVPGENRSITLYTASQTIVDSQYTAASLLGVPAANVRVTLTREGGGFGSRQSRSIYNSTAAAIAAWKLNQPVRLALDRNTNLVMCGERHPFHGKYHVAYAEDGTLKGFKIDYVSDGGNTYDLSFSIMDMAVMSADNAYQIGTYRTSGNVCQTNQLSNTAMRSFGLVQAVNLVEQAIEHVAFKLGKRPEDIREKNFYRDGIEEWTGFKLTDQTLEVLERYDSNEQARNALEPLKGSISKTSRRSKKRSKASKTTTVPRSFQGPSTSPTW